MKLKLLFITIALLVCFGSSYGQLLQWNTFGNTGTETTEPSVFNDTNISASNLTQGTITAAGNTNRFGGSNWFNTGNTAAGNTLAEAVAGNDYIQFVVIPNSGYSFTPTSFVFNWDNSGTGPANVAFRSSADSFASNIGIAAPVSSIGTSNTITIVGISNITTATTFRIYGYGATAPGGTAGFDIGSNVVNVQLNGTTASSGPTSTKSGDWNDSTVWSTGTVPSNTDNVTISPAHNVFTSIALTRTGTTTVNGSFQLNAGGWATGTNFTYGATGTLNFNNTSSYGVSNVDVFWPTTNAPFNVNVLQGGLTLNSANRTVAGTFTTSAGVTLNTSTLTLNGTAQINPGGFFIQSPIFGNASTLKYNTGGTFGRGLEWSALGVGIIGTTPGYPNNIQLSGNTTLNYNNGTPSAKAIAGNLTIDANSSFYMDYGNVTSGGTLTIAGSLVSAGNLTLGYAFGDDLKIGGNITFNTGYTFDAKGRAVIFTKAGTQTITASSKPTFNYVNLTGGTTIVQLSGTDLDITAPLAGNVISFSAVGDTFDLNGRTLTLGTSGVANSILGAGTFKGSTTANMTLLGTGSIGTLNFTSGYQELGTLTMNRQAGVVGGVMGSAVTINTALNLTNGLVDLAATTMTLASTCSNTFTASSNSFVIADFTASGILRKNVTATAITYNFPIGDKTGSLDYSPATINFPSGILLSAFIGFSVQDFALSADKHPNLDATTNYISRYWSITKTGTAPNYIVTADYLASDVNGTEANCKSNQWNGTTSTWSNTGVMTGTNSLILTGITAFPATNHITKGERDAEINIKQSATNYLHNSTYTFASALTGTNNDIIFTIENLGEGNLNLGGATITGNPVYALLTNYTSPVLGITSSSFTIRFSPTIAGTFAGSISIPNNDTSGSENPYVINFSGIAVVPAPEARLERATLAEIPDGSTANSGYDTVFAGQTIGVSSTAKTYTIRNTGTANLTLSNPTLSGTNSGDFSISAASLLTITPAGTATFTVIFTPTSSGTRNATVTFLNNDSDEATYNFDISGTGNCPSTTNTITPTSGPIGTEVIINSAADLTGATVSFNGVSAMVTQISSTQIKVIVPSGATSGNLVTTNTTGCQATNAFTVIDNKTNSCQGGTTFPSDLFMSEVTDATTGGVSYIEIYNGTANTINLSNYALQVFGNGNSTVSSSVTLNNVNLVSGGIYVAAIGVSTTPDTLDTCTLITGGNGQLADQTSTSAGINFDTGGGNDYIRLFKTSTNTIVDSFGTYLDGTWANSLGLGDRGATFRRKNTATLPNATYSNSDWNIIDWVGTAQSSCSTNDYSDIGTFNFISGTPPSVTLHPSYTPTCKATSLTVAGTEGYNGSSPADTKELAYQWLVSAPNATGWTEITDSTNYSGSSSATLSIANISGVINYQYYCQIRENTNTCYTASNAIKIIDGTITWNGTDWRDVNNGIATPSLDKLAIINANYNTSTPGLGSFSACSVVVNIGKILTITAAEYVKIQNDLTNNGTVNIKTDGSLVQVNDNGANTGIITYERIVPVINSTDYTYWSSPVLNQNLQAFSPNTPSNKFYSFNAATVPEDWKSETPSSVSMDKGVGYCIYGPQMAIPPAFFVASFIGKPNNGLISVPIFWNGDPAGTSNLLGNPYPSALDADKFLATNASVIDGTLYFWTHNTPIQLASGISTGNAGTGAYAYTKEDYASYNITGGVGIAPDITAAAPSGYSGGSNKNIPNGKIAAGQAFFTTSLLVNGNAIFNNNMRIDNLGKIMGNSQFFKTRNPQTKTTAIEKHRIWLDLTNSQGVFKQTLIGYITDATNQYDNRFDGISFDANEFADFYSISQDKNLVIQGRAVPFDENDQVPLGFRTTIDGVFAINIDHLDGVLANQAVFIEDKLTNTIFDLRSGAFTFNTVAGIFNNRFVLRYTNKTLGTSDIITVENQVLVSNKNKQIKVNSKGETIGKVSVYDLLGRQLFKKDKINSSEFSILNLVSNEQTVLVKVTLQNGNEVTKKVIFN